MQDDDAQTAFEQNKVIATWPTLWIESAVKAQVMHKNHLGGYTVFNGLTPHDLSTFVLPLIQQAVRDERERLADWYRTEGWLLDEDDVSGEMLKA